MSQVYGIESPGPHHEHAHRRPTRYLLLIDAGGTRVARLFLDNHELAAEFDAGTEEVARMHAGLTPSRGAEAPTWDRALAGHSREERAAALVYTLDV